MLTFDVKQEIIDCLSKSPKPLRVILFGSYASGIPHEDSDIDLLVIVDKEGKGYNYKALIQNRKEISARLRDLKKKYPVDLIVYTNEEWEELKSFGSSFIREIEEHGVFLI
ncbi:MAG: nucleotidyltransferase domain-containing protein [Deltaproteobacteria bacterium]|nr:nucleotidyltransferase domain-containing protein [Deltaproteobacteria bacterium]